MKDPQPAPARGGAAAFALIYFTFFLDNVLLTVLVPIVPDWVRGEALALALAARAAAPDAALLNATVHRAATHDSAHSGGGGGGGAAAAVGVVLSAKAVAQLVCAAPAAAAVCRRGPAAVLRAATALLALAATALALCSRVGGAGSAAGAAARGGCAAAGRAAHGAGAAAAGVAGLALAAALPPARRDRALGALLGAVALGVLVGYPLGGAAYAMWSRDAPFLIIALALLINLALQYKFLDKEEYNQPCGGGGGGGWRAVRRAAAGGAARQCAGAVLLTTSVMAALEPCLPLWIMDKFHPQRWQTGAAFVPDSAGYLLAASALGGAARRLGPERVALAGQAAVALAAIMMPTAATVWALAGWQAALGGGLGALDAALVPALLARRPRRAPQLAALLQAAASAAYALGPVAGGALAWGAGFAATLRALGVLNLLYAALLYRALRRYPLSEQWGASAAEDSDDSGSEAEDALELAARSPHRYQPLR